MKLGDLVKFKIENKVKYGVILYDYKTRFHIKGFKPKKYYLIVFYINKKYLYNL